MRGREGDRGQIQSRRLSVPFVHTNISMMRKFTPTVTRTKKNIKPTPREKCEKNIQRVCVCFKSFWFNQTAHLKRQDYLDLNRKGTSIADGNRGKNRHHKHNCFISAEASG